MDVTDKEARREMGRTCTCFNLRKATRVITQKYDHALREVGLKGTQLSVLLCAYDQKDIQLTRMARILSMERTSLTRNLAVLERMGLISVSQGDDKRERRVSITEQGEEILRKAAPLWRNVQDEVMETLGRENWETLLSGLHQVVKKVR